MNWTNILVPMLGGDLDLEALARAKELAAPFGATITAAYSRTPPANLFSWMPDAEVGGIGVALGEMTRGSTAGEARARDAFAALEYRHKAFETHAATEWLGLRTASRLADLVVWNAAAVRGHGPFADAFQTILMNERRPTVLAGSALARGGLVAVAWDGGAEASRAVRRAVPWLQKADQVVVLTAPHAMARPCEPGRILRYLADNAIPAEPIALHSRGEPGKLIVETARRLVVDMLVAGAFGHPRLQRFIFGGTTQALLESAPDPVLFLSH